MDKKKDIFDATNIHFFGVGGIGVSAIARMMLMDGKKISGSDLVESENTRELEKLGVKIFINQNISDVPKDTDLIVYSAAIEVADKKLFDEIKKMPIGSISYSEALGQISAGKFTIAVAGTHGKTTTTAMIAKILIDAGLDPTVIVGSISKDIGSNFRSGKSEFLVVEADEYRRSFLSLNPSIAVITNIDLDHLDYYKDMSDIQGAFVEFLNNMPDDGALVTDLSKKNVVSVVEKAKVLTIDYGSVEDLDISLKFPGRHNIENAKAAIAVSGLLEIDHKIAKRSLSDFKGTSRRFEFKGETATGALVYDDYAHNPQKVEALISGAKEFFSDKNVTIIFQPHLYSRTKHLFSEFTKVLAKSDRLIITDIFPAREKLDPSISSEMLADAVSKVNKNTLYLKNFTDIELEIKKNSSKKDVVITVGAGDIYKLAEMVIN